MHYHFVKKKVLAREIDLIHVNVKNQVVNIFTKVLSIDKLLKFRGMVGVLDHMWRIPKLLDRFQWKFKVETTKKLGVGARSLVRSTFEGRRAC